MPNCDKLLNFCFAITLILLKDLTYINSKSAFHLTVKRFEKFRLKISISLFAIRVNLLHPSAY